MDYSKLPVEGRRATLEQEEQALLNQHWGADRDLRKVQAWDPAADSATALELAADDANRSEVIKGQEQQKKQQAFEVMTRLGRLESDLRLVREDLAALPPPKVTALPKAEPPAETPAPTGEDKSDSGK